MNQTLRLRIILSGHRRTMNDSNYASLCSSDVLYDTPRLLGLRILFRPLRRRFCLPSILMGINGLLNYRIRHINRRRRLPILLFIVMSSRARALEVILTTLVSRRSGLYVHRGIL